MPKQDKYDKCPCCGYAVEKRIGKPNGTQLFGPVQQRLFNVVRDCPDGISGPALYERVWGYSERSHNIVAVTIKCINRKISKWGLKIKGHGGPGSIYHLLRIGEDVPPRWFKANRRHRAMFQIEVSPDSLE